MAIEALIFDLGGVILELDWEKYREDKNREVPIQNLWLVYEKLNPALAQFLVQMRPHYKLATITCYLIYYLLREKYTLSFSFSAKVGQAQLDTSPAVTSFADGRKK